MIARETLRQIAGQERLFRFLDGADRNALDKHVRRQDDQRARLVPGACVDQRNGATVAMADQDWVADAELAEQLRQHALRLAMHIVDAARFGEHTGVAVAIARIGERAAVASVGKALRKVAPLADRTQAFMKKDERGPLGVARRHRNVLELVVLNDDAGHAGIQSTERASIVTCGPCTQARGPAHDIQGFHPPECGSCGAL